MSKSLYLTIHGVLYWVIYVGGQYAGYRSCVLKGEIISQKLKVVALVAGAAMPRSYWKDLLSDTTNCRSAKWLVDVEGGKAKLDIISNSPTDD
ncbi:hypothetical protein ACNKHR_25845 [Shigella flexneri]